LVEPFGQVTADLRFDLNVLQPSSGLSRFSRISFASVERLPLNSAALNGRHNRPVKP